MSKPQDIRLGYLLLSSPVQNTYLGGLMVTDGRGLPIEFRYTEPIQPTRIQQILYGQSLTHYIKTDVILETLLKHLETKIKCLLVEDEIFMTHPIKGVRVVRIQETRSAPLSKPGSIEEIGPGEVLLQTSRESNPIRVYYTHPEEPVTCIEDRVSEALPPGLPANTTIRGGLPDSVLGWLIEAGRGMDLCEPLKRIEKALEAICLETGIPTPAGR